MNALFSIIVTWAPLGIWPVLAVQLHPRLRAWYEEGLWRSTFILAAVFGLLRLALGLILWGIVLLHPIFGVISTIVWYLGFVLFWPEILFVESIRPRLPVADMVYLIYLIYGLSAVVVGFISSIVSLTMMTGISLLTRR